MSSTQDDDYEELQINDYCTLYCESDDWDALLIGRVESTSPTAVRVLYDSTPEDRDNPETTDCWVDEPEEIFYSKLPKNGTFEDRNRDALDYALGLVTPQDALALLDGEPAHQTGGRRGFEALRFFALEGIHKSITEWSVHQGHGPGRYGRSVRNRVEDLPDWLAESALESEKERWSGSMTLGRKSAGCIVEVLLLKQDLLDEDHESEIVELVNEHDLEYDKYRSDYK